MSKKQQAKKQPAKKQQAKKRHSLKSDGARAQNGGSHEMSSKSDPCGVSTRCGACHHMTEPYDAQLASKSDYVANLFFDAGLVESPDYGANSQVKPTIGMEDPRFYRNKVTSPFARGKRLADGKRSPRYQILTGMYAAHTHRIVNTDGCLIENEQAKLVIKTIKQLMGRFGIEPYDEDSQVGFLRHAVVRVGHNSGEVLVTLVTNGDKFPSSRAFCRELVKRCPFVTTVVQNVNTRNTNVILGEREKCLYGPGFILDTLCGLSFRISSKSFYQVNSTQTEVLYDTAIGLAGLDGTQDAIDAYCGTGTIGLVAAARGARSVIGVDSVESAIRDARENARHNGIENAEFVAQDASAFMREVAAGRSIGGRSADGAELPERADAHSNSLVVFMDPPRAGSTEEFLDSLAVLSPARVVYISCNPETQVRDIAYLSQYGYDVVNVVPVDMFPHTDHVETVALLAKSFASRPRAGSSRTEGVA